MTNQSFQNWLAGLDRLTPAQWSQLQQAVQERSEGAAAVAAIELQIDTERRCPHCQAGGAVRRGTTRGLRRYSCKRCGKTFNALSGTALSGVVSHINSWNRQVFGPDYSVTYWLGRRNSPGEVNALAPWYAYRKP